MQLNINQSQAYHFILLPPQFVNATDLFIWTRRSEGRQNKAEFPVGVNKITARPTLLAWPQELNFFRNFHFSFNPLVPEIKIQILLTCRLRFL